MHTGPWKLPEQDGFPGNYAMKQIDTALFDMEHGSL